MLGRSLACPRIASAIPLYPKVFFSPIKLQREGCFGLAFIDREPVNPHLLNREPAFINQSTESRFPCFFPGDHNKRITIDHSDLSSSLTTIPPNPIPRAKTICASFLFCHLSWKSLLCYVLGNPGSSHSCLASEKKKISG